MREKLIYLFSIAAMALIAWDLYRIFMVLPDEANQGAIYRIIYFHVPAAIVAMTGFFVAMVGSALYLITRDLRFDSVAAAVTEVSVVFAAVNLVTGSIWARVIWGIWWTWDARLTSTFVLWLLYVSYLLLRTLIEEPDRRALLSSLFGIFAFIDVPLVFGAIRWWRTQHPSPVIMGGQGSGLEPTMKAVFFFSVFAMHVFMTFLIVERYILEKTKAEVDILRREVEAQ
jgi:heme exporter protein C